MSVVSSNGRSSSDLMALLVSQMLLEANEQCACRSDDHPLGRCTNRTTAIDGLCNGCRAAMELSVEKPPSGRFLGWLQSLLN